MVVLVRISNLEHHFHERIETLFTLIAEVPLRVELQFVRTSLKNLNEM